MKKLIFALLLFGCQPENDIQMGCLTGEIDGFRGYIRCCTREEYLAGSNVNAGGTANWTAYKNHQWQPVDDCKNCH